MAQAKQPAAIIAAVALLLISLCAAGGLVWWYSDESSTPPGVSATAPPSNTQATTDAQIVDINQRLNSLPNWTLWGGSWQDLHPGLRGVGVGDSGAEFNPDLPGNIRITFTMNVVDGMRPRVYMEGPGVYFGNEGFTKQLSIFGPDVRQLHGNPIPYKNGQLMHVAITIDHGSTTVLVDNNTITCQCHLCDRVRLRLEGGDNWSQGTTEYGNIQVEAVNGR